MNQSDKNVNSHAMPVVSDRRDRQIDRLSSVHRTSLISRMTKPLWFSALNNWQSKTVKFVLLFYLLGQAIFSGGCAGSWEGARAVRKASLESGHCSVHHAELKSVLMYDLSETVPSDMSEIGIKLWRRYPNAEAFYQPTKSRYFQKPVTVRACPVCQHLYAAAIRDRERPDP